MLNIPSYKNDDPNYRYKMPRLVAKVEGRGNGIRTNIVNMGEIARALKRPPEYSTRFCGVELGAQSKFDPAEGKAIVTGDHNQRDLQSLIDKFIEKFVLCHKCHLPEIDLLVRKGRIQYLCNACGDKGDGDNVHKLAAFIIKNPPESSTMGKALSKKKEKDVNPVISVVKLSKYSDDVDETASQDEDVSSKGKKSSKKSKKSRKTKLEEPKNDRDDDDSGKHTETKSKTSKDKGYSDDENGNGDDLSDNTREKSGGAAQESADALKTSKSIGKYTKTGKSVKSTSENVSDSQKTTVKDQVNRDDPNFNMYVLAEVVSAIEQLSNLLCGKSSTAATDSEEQSPNEPSVSPVTFCNELIALQTEYQFDYTIRFYIALRSLFCEELQGLSPETLCKQMAHLQAIMAYKPQRDILIALQDFLYFHDNTAILSDGYKAFPAILYKFYECDLLTGESIIRFYTVKSFSKGSEWKHAKALDAFDAAKAAAEPMIGWLKDDDDDTSGVVASSSEASPTEDPKKTDC